jgi:hypothetical protein
MQGDLPVVTLFGAYDSGKSSFLKRLLVDDGRDVPPWLTVAARKETFEVNEIVACGCLFRDTPGLVGPGDWQENTAVAALVLSDVYFLVMPPQLLTVGEGSEENKILDVMTGRFFGGANLPLFGDGCLHAIVARMDEAGIDPTCDESGYVKLRERKRGELKKLLRRCKVDLDLTRIHLVAADAFQTVGNMPKPSRSLYDDFRGWDGMDELARDIRQLPALLDDLRSHALARYLVFLVVGAKEELGARSRKCQEGLEESANQIERLSLFERQLAAVEGAARSDLERRVEEVLLAAGRRVAASAESMTAILSPRLDEAFHAWAAVQDAEMDRLTSEAQAELDRRQASPGGRTLADLLSDDANAEEEHSEQMRHAVKGARKLGPVLRDGLKHYHEQKLGISLKDAAAELQRIKKAGSLQEHLKRAKNAVLRTAEEVNQAQKIVRLHKILSVAGPAAIELASLVQEALEKGKSARENARRREDLRAQVRKSATTLSEEKWNSWKGSADAFREWLDRGRKAHSQVRTVLEEDTRILKDAISGIDRLLADLPM